MLQFIRAKSKREQNKSQFGLITRQTLTNIFEHSSYLKLFKTVLIKFLQNSLLCVILLIITNLVILTASYANPHLISRPIYPYFYRLCKTNLIENISHVLILINKISASRFCKNRLLKIKNVTHPLLSY